MKLLLPLLLLLVLPGCTPEGGLPPLTTSVEASAPKPVAPPPPPVASAYREMLVQNARFVWGMNAPIATFAGQLHQESGWNPNAVSPAGAQGIAQFMPKTSAWIDDVYPELGQAQPYNPEWSIRAMLRYDKHLYDRATSAADECNQHTFALVGYNGGEGWRIRDQKLAAQSGLDPSRYWGNVETVNAGRSAAAWKENRGYPERIIKVLQPKYQAWGRTVCIS